MDALITQTTKENPLYNELLVLRGKCSDLEKSLTDKLIPFQNYEIGMNKIESLLAKALEKYKIGRIEKMAE